MPSITLTIKYQKNSGQVISSEELLDLYFYGIKIQSKDGSTFPKETIDFHIKAAQNELEEYLKIKLNPQLFEENVSYYRDDYKWNYPIIKTRYPVNDPLSVIGMFNRVEQITYPPEWLQSHSNSDGVFQKRISIVPSSSTSVNTSQDFILTGMTTQLGLGSSGNIPDYWHIQYVTGFNPSNIPFTLLNIIGMYAAIPLLLIAGDMVLGPGISGNSLSIDGLSQNITTSASAGTSAFAHRIKQYSDNIKDTLDKVKIVYRGYNWTVM